MAGYARMREAPATAGHFRNPHPNPLPEGEGVNPSIELPTNALGDWYLDNCIALESKLHLMLRLDFCLQGTN
jgi:hypothetical protein